MHHRTRVAIRSRRAAASILLAAAMAGPAPATAREPIRSAASVSCAILGRPAGLRSPRGVQAVQWIVGYLSGAITEGPPRSMIRFAGADGVALWVRRFCASHPSAMAVDAAEAIVRESVPCPLLRPTTRKDAAAGAARPINVRQRATTAANIRPAQALALRGPSRSPT